METQDGFILGIFNYCDRWCERCTLSGRCSVFAEEQRMVFGAPSSFSGAMPAPRSLGAAAAGFEAAQPDEGADLQLDEDSLRRAEPNRSRRPKVHVG